MRAVRVWRSVLGVQHTVIEKVELESVGGEEVLVATVRPTRSRQGRCGRCDRRAPRYDNGEGPRRWRGLDAGTTRVYLQAKAPRVSCPVHGVIVAAVPWARHGSRFTSAFEDTAAWLACHAAFSVLAALLRITWRSVAAVITRVVTQRAAQSDRLTGLRRIGVDEISYRYVGDPCQGVSREPFDELSLGHWVEASALYEASAPSRLRIPSKIFWRPICPFVAASSR